MDRDRNKDVEKVLFERCMEGDRQAIVFWLQNRDKRRWGSKEDRCKKENKRKKKGDAVQKLAELINNPVERGG